MEKAVGIMGWAFNFGCDDLLKDSKTYNNQLTSWEDAERSNRV